MKVGNTWQYSKREDRIRLVTGKNSPSNPFDNQDAFTATALYLRDRGADGTYSGDREAALRYYAGGYWSLPANSFYGDQVMERKSRLDRDIRTLQSG